HLPKKILCGPHICLRAGRLINLQLKCSEYLISPPQPLTGIERGERMFCPLQMDEASSALFWGTMLAKSHSCMVAGSL
ncbi:hypothetical protein KY289_009926, partial [Solanum tuberosum]